MLLFLSFGYFHAPVVRSFVHLSSHLSVCLCCSIVFLVKVSSCFSSPFHFSPFFCKHVLLQEEWRWLRSNSIDDDLRICFAIRRRRWWSLNSRPQMRKLLNKAKEKEFQSTLTKKGNKCWGALKINRKCSLVYHSSRISHVVLLWVPGCVSLYNRAFHRN